MNFRFLAAAVALLAATAEAQETSRLAVETANPSLRVTTQNPPEINIGKPAAFAFTVKNEGQATAMGVRIETRIPGHAELIGAEPEPVKVEGLQRTFHLGDLPPGESRQIKLVTIPRKVALIRISSTVSFATSTEASLVVRQPNLVVSSQIAPEVVIGKATTWTVRVANTGDGPAEAVTLIPALLEGQLAGDALGRKIDIGLLAAGKSRDIEIEVLPTRSGKLAARFVTTNPDGLKAEHSSASKVLQARLALSTKGPRIQPLGHAGQYQVSITNTGDASTGPGSVTIKIPEGLEITSAAENAWNNQTRSLRWRVTNLGPGGEVTLRFQAETNAEGSQELMVTVEAEDQHVQPATATHTTRVISRANPIVTVLNDQEFTPVGRPIGFKIVVLNAGSKVADDLRVRVALSEELSAIEQESYKLTDEMIEFPLQKLQSGEKVTLPFFAVGTREGEHHVRVLLDGSTLSRQLSFESSAFCYVDGEVDEALSRTGGAE